MTALLKKLRLSEVSLVDRPASPDAMITLFKRDTLEDTNKMTDEMEAKLKAYMDENGVDRDVAMKAMNMYKREDVEKAEAEVATLKADNEMLRKGLIDNGFTISATAIEKKAEVETIEVEGELVVKSDIPAPVLKALEAAAVEKAAHVVEKADIELTKNASEKLPNWDITVAKALVEKFADDEAIMLALMAADAAFDAAMEEFGKSDVDGDFASPADQLDALVKSYMDTNKMKKSEFAKAYAEVAKTAEGRTLITKSYKGE